MNRTRISAVFLTTFILLMLVFSMNTQAGEPCYSNNDCNDQNPCTSDVCEMYSHTCVHRSVANCNCDDGNLCTIDTYVPLSNSCKYTPVVCADDGDSCTLNHRCNPTNGKCISDKENEGKICNNSTGVCENYFDLLPGPSPVPQFFSSSKCVNKCYIVKNSTDASGTLYENGTTNPDNSCEVCNTSIKLRNWSYDNGKSCDDNDKCSSSSICSNGTCIGDGTVSCDDKNSCTQDSCDPLGGCSHTAVPGCCNVDPECNDYNGCTVDKCLNNVCQHTGNPIIGLTCEDNDCKVNKCVQGPAGGKSIKCEANTGANCSDGSLCTTGDKCDANASCIGGTALNCNDGQFCNGTETCVAATGCAGGTPPCNSAIETCDEMKDMCVNKCSTMNCGDGNPCTDDSCDKTTAKCAHTSNALACNDGDACTENDKCGEGSCRGIVKSCNDGNLCTTDTCDTKSGCVFTNNSLACDDGNRCTTGDECMAGRCEAASAIVCNDGNPCTDDNCNPVSGCVVTPNTAPCSDGDRCTDGDVCGGGICVAGTPKVCDDGNECTEDRCDPAKGCVATNNTNACDDGSDCTEGDVCGGGVCKGETSSAAICQEAPKLEEQKASQTYALDNARALKLNLTQVNWTSTSDEWPDQMIYVYGCINERCGRDKLALKDLFDPEKKPAFKFEEGLFINPDIFKLIKFYGVPFTITKDVFARKTGVFNDSVKRGDFETAFVADNFRPDEKEQMFVGRVYSIKGGDIETFEEWYTLDEKIRAVIVKRYDWELKPFPMTEENITGEAPIDNVTNTERSRLANPSNLMTVDYDGYAGPDLVSVFKQYDDVKTGADVEAIKAQTKTPDAYYVVFDPSINEWPTAMMLKEDVELADGAPIKLEEGSTIELSLIGTDPTQDVLNMGVICSLKTEGDCNSQLVVSGDTLKFTMPERSETEDGPDLSVNVYKDAEVPPAEEDIYKITFTVTDPGDLSDSKTIYLSPTGKAVEPPPDIKPIPKGIEEKVIIAAPEEKLSGWGAVTGGGCSNIGDRRKGDVRTIIASLILMLVSCCVLAIVRRYSKEKDIINHH